MSKKRINKLVSILKTLNTNAEIIPISNGKIKIDKILNTGLFDFEKAQQSPGWMQEMNGEHIPETEEYGISSFVYEARRPFYPEKFHNFLHSKDIAGKLIRSKGFFGLHHGLCFGKLESSGRNSSSWFCWNVLEQYQKTVGLKTKKH